MAGVESMIVEEKQAPTKQIDREKVHDPKLAGALFCRFIRNYFLFVFQTCPLLLRVFCSTGRHHSPSEFMHGNVPSNELQIYTWQDATLRELTALVRDVNPETRRKGTYFDFALVSPDQFNTGYRMREFKINKLYKR